MWEPGPGGVDSDTLKRKSAYSEEYMNKLATPVYFLESLGDMRPTWGKAPPLLELIIVSDLYESYIPTGCAWYVNSKQVQRFLLVLHTNKGEAAPMYVSCHQEHGIFCFSVRTD